jgi:hypothetical protein
MPIPHLKAVPRQTLPFRAVNRRTAPDYDPGMQRHHLLPRQLLSHRCFHSLFATLDPHLLGFDDFRSNGLLLPADDRAAVRFGLPLHRGPHRIYNELAIERVGQIEAGWSARKVQAPDTATAEARARIDLLQRALRRLLLAPQRRLKLNRRDPLGTGVDFAELDAMAASLWPETEV